MSRKMIWTAIVAVCLPVFAASLPAAAAPAVPAGDLRHPSQDFVTLVGCAEQREEHCRAREASCNATGRESAFECRRKYRICLQSTRCLEGS